jgi:redox-sensitive bicupin YhaK (pirin superfamily)
MVMNTIIHRAETRGSADHGWLRSFHTFSFAGYYDPSRIHFGALRVLNDDKVAPGRGFGAHPHDNMEIISIPLSGSLAHKDSMGNEGIIRVGEIQVMSAGTGIVHSEMNASPNEEVCFLQIWVFPDRKNVVPRYDQVNIDDALLKNNLHPIIGSFENPAITWIYQHVLFSLGNIETGTTINYDKIDHNNGIYIFLIEGEITIGDEILKKRDGMAIIGTDNISINATAESKILVMDIPLLN